MTDIPGGVAVTDQWREPHKRDQFAMKPKSAIHELRTWIGNAIWNSNGVYRAPSIADAHQWHKKARQAERYQAKLEASLEQMQAVVEAMRRIVQWSEAYPLDVFPEPDFKKAHKLLKAGGMTLDAISASNMRHVVEGVGKIAKESLAALDEHEWQHPMTLREIMESEEKAD